MLTIAYLANQFPVSVEPYVSDEIDELQRRGVKVIPGSVRRATATKESAAGSGGGKSLCILPLRLLTLLRSLGLAVRYWKRISRLVGRVLLEGKETAQRRFKALLHTWLGAYYAILLRDRCVNHIHIHHGFFGSWIGMVAAQLLGIKFSFTLHGSDLLLRSTYLDVKLSYCEFCITISEYNRRYILEHFPEIDPRKIVVSRLGVSTPLATKVRHQASASGRRKFILLAVGRLHAVKDHAFLVHACAQLRDLGLDFECLIAGEGPERRFLESLMRRNRLQDRVTLLGHVCREKMDSLYRQADLVVLTSRSEGIPLVLMEAMALGIIVVAPAITGIPELVIPGKTGFLYKAGNVEDFVHTIRFLQILMQVNLQFSANGVDRVRHAARVQILNNFSHDKNLNRFSDLFLELVAPHYWTPHHEDFVLQQI
ncbi:MAG: glycosyltransferase family 4 protein [Candidatus Sulfotelmatobacter sp.]